MAEMLPVRASHKSHRLQQRAGSARIDAASLVSRETAAAACTLELLLQCYLCRISLLGAGAS
jgi:hypothetical protein